MRGTGDPVLIRHGRCAATVALLAGLAGAGCGQPPDEARPWAGAADLAAETESERFTFWPPELREFRLGVTPYLDRQGMEQAFVPLLTLLSERLGVPARLVIADGYSDLGERMRAQEVDLGEFSPLSYVEAKQSNPGLRLILRQVAEGATSYLGYVYVRADDPAESLRDLAGRSFCFVDPHSTSGFLYPRAVMIEQGIDPDRFFGETEFGGNHLECLRRVLEGEADAGAAYSGAFFAARQRGLQVHRLKVLAKTARIPFDAYCTRSGLPEPAVRRLEEELLNLSTRSPAGRRVLGGAIKLNAWTQARDSDYDSVRRALAASRNGIAARTAPLDGSEPARPSSDEDRSAWVLEPPRFTPWPAEQVELRLGLIPDLDRETVQQSFEPLLSHLTRRLGVPAHLVVAESYAELVARMRSQEVDLAHLGPLTYVEAKLADPGIRLLLKQVAGGSTTYLGYVYTRADDPASSLRDLSRRSICYVDPHSTSGYLYPRAMIIDRGLNPDRFFGETVFGGDHMECLRRVLEDEVDVGVAYSGAFFAARRQAIPVHRLKVVAKTSRIPSDAYCVRSGLPAAAASRLKEELLHLTSQFTEGRRILADITNLDGWAEADDSEYNSVRRVLFLTREWEARTE